MGPVRLGGVVGHVFNPNVVIMFVKNGVLTRDRSDGDDAGILELNSSFPALLRFWDLKTKLSVQ